VEQRNISVCNVFPRRDEFGVWQRQPVSSELCFTVSHADLYANGERERGSISIAFSNFEWCARIFQPDAVLNDVADAVVVSFAFIEHRLHPNPERNTVPEPGCDLVAVCDADSDAVEQPFATCDGVVIWNAVALQWNLPFRHPVAVNNGVGDCKRVI
jgi:hypothetical protein